MSKLKELQSFLEKSDLKVEVQENGSLIVSEKIDESIQVPTDLVAFVTVYEQESNIIAKNGGYELTVTKFSANNFLKLLSSVFSADYSFEMTGEYTILIKPIQDGIRPNGASEGLDEELDKGLDEKCKKKKSEESDESEDLDESKFYRVYKFKNSKDSEGVASEMNNSEIKWKETDWAIFDNEIEAYTKEAANELEKIIKDNSIKAEISENSKLSFEQLAKKIDSEDLEIELHEDGLKVETSASNIMNVAEKIDSLAKGLVIEAYDKYILVS